ncbi:dUTP diphosphatase [Ceratobasidium sp. AG-I]|nr:dUTP diphosphatase [Ceratobasidium sp. AG-I]
MAIATKRVEPPSPSSTPPPAKMLHRDVVDEPSPSPPPAPAPALAPEQAVAPKQASVTLHVPVPIRPPSSNLLIKRLSEKARLPTRGSALAAGYDLYSAERQVVPAHKKAMIDTQLSLAVPIGTYGRVAPRSGLASKFMISTGAGVVDADYRGTLFVLLFNHSDKDFIVEEGERIAQLILEKIVTPEVMEVESLDDTLRGAAGFGSTGGHAAL